MQWRNISVYLEASIKSKWITVAYPLIMTNRVTVIYFMLILAEIWHKYGSKHVAFALLSNNINIDKN